MHPQLVLAKCIRSSLRVLVLSTALAYGAGSAKGICDRHLRLQCAQSLVTTETCMQCFLNKQQLVLLGCNAAEVFQLCRRAATTRPTRSPTSILQYTPTKSSSYEGFRKPTQSHSHKCAPSSCLSFAGVSCSGQYRDEGPGNTGLPIYTRLDGKFTMSYDSSTASWQVTSASNVDDDAGQSETCMKTRQSDIRTRFSNGVPEAAWWQLHHLADRGVWQGKELQFTCGRCKRLVLSPSPTRLPTRSPTPRSTPNPSTCVGGLAILCAKSLHTASACMHCFIQHQQVLIQRVAGCENAQKIMQLCELLATSSPTVSPTMVMTSAPTPSGSAHGLAAR